MSNISYNESLYETNSLAFYAKLFLRKLPRGVRGLLTRGSSGCALASAMLVLSKRNMLHTHVRKNSEKAHSGISRRDNTITYAIVDDFIDTGNTVLELIGAATSSGLKVKYVLVCHLQCSELSVLPELAKALRYWGIKLIQVEPY